MNESWVDAIPQPVWGLIGIILSVALSWLVARREAKTQFRRSLHLRDLDEVYRPVLEGLNRFKLQWDSHPFPIAFYWHGPPNHQHPGHFDLAWWGELKRRGDEMRLDSATRTRLEHLEEACVRYERLRERAHSEVDQAISNAFQLAGITKWFPKGLADTILAGDDFTLNPLSLGVDAVGAENAAVLARRAALQVKSLNECARARSAIEISLGKGIHVVRSRMAKARAEL